MKKGLTELVFILDRSGSMSGLEGDTIGGFNSMIKKQKKEKGECFVTTILFSNSNEVLHDRVSISNIEPMTDSDYTAYGCTALLDAIGSTIDHISTIHKYARAEDIPEHTLFVITTDGMENASRKYSVDKIREMIECRKKNLGWEFLFLGANMDAVSTAQHFEINADRAVTFTNDSRGIAANYQAVTEVVSAVRACKPLNPSWKQNIEKDHKSR